MLVIWQLKDIKDNNDLVNIVARISFVVFIFFISQVLLRLYRYNMMMADFYIACCDAIEMSDQYNDAQKTWFEKLIKVLSPDKIVLEVPDNPKASDFNPQKEK